jgi:hypothetical protein
VGYTSYLLNCFDCLLTLPDQLAGEYMDWDAFHRIIREEGKQKILDFTQAFTEHLGMVMQETLKWDNGEGA